MKLLGIALGLLVVGIEPASAQAPRTPAEPLDEVRLAIDDCGVKDPALTDDELRRQGAEHYSRGETLYLQGDYLGAVSELVASYCKIPYYSILKDIGQAYERNLDYEQAVAYLERYVREMPPDAKRTSPCAADPQEDKKNVERRIKVLRELRAHVAVQTEPTGATITLELLRDRRVQSVAITGERSAKDIAIFAGRYEMRIEKRGFKTETRKIEVQIGKPYNYFYRLKPLEGTLSVQVTPADAKIFLEEAGKPGAAGTTRLFVGVGRYDARLEAKQYVITSERRGRITDRHLIEVLPDQLQRVQIELTPTPQFGRRQMLVFAPIAGGLATGALLNAFGETFVAGLGVLGGTSAALLGTYLYLDDDVPLGASNLAITSSIAATVAGTATGLLFTDEDRILQPVAGASMILGAGVGFYLGERTKIRTGDAALINSSLMWGTAAGALFAASFAPPRAVGAGLVLSGLGLGGVGGTIMTRYFDISRTHALLIDIGGIVGILGGLAVAGIAYAPPDASSQFDEEQLEHFANYSLGGMVVGLIGAGILTRNIDAPKLGAATSIQPSINNATTADGARTMTYGLAGRW